MDVLIVGRRPLRAASVPLRCACGRVLSGWSPTTDHIVKCPDCDRREYQLLGFAVTDSRDARELVYAARGVVLDDLPAFEAQGFHVLRPTGDRFFPTVPSITGELTLPDGSLKGLPPPTPLSTLDSRDAEVLADRLRFVFGHTRVSSVDSYGPAEFTATLVSSTGRPFKVTVHADARSTVESLVDAIADEAHPQM